MKSTKKEQGNESFCQTGSANFGPNGPTDLSGLLQDRVVPNSSVGSNRKGPLHTVDFPEFLAAWTRNFDSKFLNQNYDDDTPFGELSSASVILGLDNKKSEALRVLLASSRQKLDFDKKKLFKITERRFYYESLGIKIRLFCNKHSEKNVQ